LFSDMEDVDARDKRGHDGINRGHVVMAGLVRAIRVPGAAQHVSGAVQTVVMAGLVPAIHDFGSAIWKTWMPARSFATRFCERLCAGMTDFKKENEARGLVFRFDRCKCDQDLSAASGRLLVQTTAHGCRGLGLSQSQRTVHVQPPLTCSSSSIFSSRIPSCDRSFVRSRMSSFPLCGLHLVAATRSAGYALSALKRNDFRLNRLQLRSSSRKKHPAIHSAWARRSRAFAHPTLAVAATRTPGYAAAALTRPTRSVQRS
jgi:hypothetical protein